MKTQGAALMASLKAGLQYIEGFVQKSYYLIYVYFMTNFENVTQLFAHKQLCYIPV